MQASSIPILRIQIWSKITIFTAELKFNSRASLLLGDSTCGVPFQMQNAIISNNTLLTVRNTNETDHFFFHLCISLVQDFSLH